MFSDDGAEDRLGGNALVRVGQGPAGKFVAKIAFASDGSLDEEAFQAEVSAYLRMQQACSACVPKFFGWMPVTYYPCLYPVLVFEYVEGRPLSDPASAELTQSS